MLFEHAIFVPPGYTRWATYNSLFLPLSMPNVPMVPCSYLLSFPVSWCCAVLWCAVLCCDVLCCAALCCAVLWCAVVCCAVLCSAALYIAPCWSRSGGCAQHVLW